MFIRQCFRKKDGKQHAYWALVESYRTDTGPRQRVVAWLGKLDEAGRLGVERAARNTGPSPTNGSATACGEQQLSLFSQLDDGALVQPQGVEVDAACRLARKCAPAIPVFAGDTVDVTTVEHIVETREKRYRTSDRIWVMDRGMVSEDNNIDFLGNLDKSPAIWILQHAVVA